MNYYKAADNKATDAEFKRIAEEVGDDMLFTKKEFRYAQQILIDGEEVTALSSGHAEGTSCLMMLTDKRIILIDKGFLYGVDFTFIPHGKISAVRGEMGAVWGKITIYHGSQTLLIRNVPKKTVPNLIARLQEHILRP